MQYVAPPKACDLCHCEIKTVFYDFRIPGDGRWANGCHNCFHARQGKLGVGNGQKYRLEADGHYWKEGTYKASSSIGSTFGDVLNHKNLN